MNSELHSSQGAADNAAAASYEMASGDVGLHRSRCQKSAAASMKCSNGNTKRNTKIEEQAENLHIIQWFAGVVPHVACCLVLRSFALATTRVSPHLLNLKAYAPKCRASQRRTTDPSRSLALRFSQRLRLGLWVRHRHRHRHRHRCRHQRLHQLPLPLHLLLQQPLP